MKKNTIIAALLASVVMFSGTAAYAQHGHTGGDQVKSKHFNKGGQRGGKHFNKGGQRGGKHFGGQRGGMMGQHFVEAADTDNDGKVSEDEMKAYKEAEFKKYDTDNDGKLSQDEMTSMRDAHKAAMQAERFSRLDTNNDGAISQEELSNGHKGGPKNGGQGNN